MTRPYVHPVIPQGDFGQAFEAAKLAVEAVRAAYSAVEDSYGYAEHTIRLIRASLPQVHDTAADVVDDGVRIEFWSQQRGGFATGCVDDDHATTSR